jgi:hypothetical protein
MIASLRSDDRYWVLAGHSPGELYLDYDRVTAMSIQGCSGRLKLAVQGRYDRKRNTE